MGLKKFEIFLDNPTGTYEPGSKVTGKLLFTLDNPMKIRALTLQFKGEANVEWEEGSGKSAIDYTGYENYLLKKYKLAGGRNRNTEIPPANRVYTFSFDLPPLIPSSFEAHEFRYIKYTVKATLYRPCRSNKHVEKVFTVVKPIDLNDNAQAKEPVKLEVETTMEYCCCLCCCFKFGPLTMVISLPRTGYVPGQNIPVTLEVDNASKIHVNKVDIYLNRVIECVANKPWSKEKVFTNTIYKWTLDGVEPHSFKLFTEQLAVPEIPIYNIDQCSIIKCSYNLEVVVKPGFLYDNLNKIVPILLGTAPNQK